MSGPVFGFAGCVAIVTGAGGGLGRTYALEFARRGARVVVNDLGGSFKGEGSSTSMADKVVKEIVDAGGEAVANYDSVENGENIIGTAIKQFGKVDILVNNAGILRDRSFGKLTENEWDQVFQVHVKGAFKCTKAAWPHMRNQKYGRIVMTTSPAGLYGNFGQANYSAAKLALVGLANTLSLEGKKSNIHVNVIAPLAETRMTADILPGTGLRPEHVSPFVVYMCHKSCKDTGVVLETAGGFACKTRLQRSNSVQLRQFVADCPSVEIVADHWESLSEYTQSTNPESVQQASDAIMASIENLPAKALPTDADPVTRVKAYVFPNLTFCYSANDVIMYALSVGASLPNDSCFLYEGHSKFSVIPSFAAILSQKSVFKTLTEGFPGLENVIDVSKALHGEQYVELFKSLPTSGRLSSKTRITDVIDKKKFCQVIVDSDIYDEKNERVCHSQFVLLFLGSKGIGKRGMSTEQVPCAPHSNRPADKQLEEAVSTNQAAFYRLNGDSNPLHIDPDFAAALGFSQPILHGLCTYGYSLRHVLKSYAGNDVSAFKSVKAQFSKPVLPGQTLITEMWQEGRRVHFQTKVKETGDLVIKSAYVDLIVVKNRTPEPTTSLKSDDVISAMKSMLKNTPDIVKNMSGTFLLQITKDSNVAGEHFLDFNSSPPAISPGNGKDADVIIKVSDDDFVSLSEEKLNPMKAFMAGKLKVSGKVMMAQKLGDLFKAYGVNKLAGKSSDVIIDPSLKSSGLFKSIEDRLTSSPDVSSKMKGSFLFQITKGNKIAGEWLMDFNNSPFSISYGRPTSKPDVTIKVDDSDFESLATGKLQPMQAFMKGKLKATGKIMMAQKLGDVFKGQTAKL